MEAAPLSSARACARAGDPAACASKQPRCRRPSAQARRMDRALCAGTGVSVSAAGRRDDLRSQRRLRGARVGGPGGGPQRGAIGAIVWGTSAVCGAMSGWLGATPIDLPIPDRAEERHFHGASPQGGEHTPEDGVLPGLEAEPGTPIYASGNQSKILLANLRSHVRRPALRTSDDPWRRTSKSAELPAGRSRIGA